jgi:hypothetical protein
MLWRAVPQREPWFGRGSFWTPDVDFAGRFAGWLDARFPGLSPHVLYRAKVKVTDGAHLKLPAFPFLESYRVMARAVVFSAEFVNLRRPRPMRRCVLSPGATAGTEPHR